MTKTTKCKHCGYDCPSELIGEHLGQCDESPKEKKKQSKDSKKYFKLMEKGVIIAVVSFILMYAMIDLMGNIFWLSSIVFMIAFVFTWIMGIIVCFKIDKKIWIIPMIVFGFGGTVVFYLYFKLNKDLQKKIN